MTAPRGRNPGVTARVRWRSQRNPSWEIETHHPGFTLAEDAALFANGFLTRSPESLTLREGRLELRLTDGTQTEMRRKLVQVWRLPGSFDRSQPADDISFERVDAPLDALSDFGLDGPWTPLAYGVIGPTGEAIDVVLQIDETGGLSVITVDEKPEPATQEAASFALAVMPKA